MDETQALLENVSSGLSLSGPSSAENDFKSFMAPQTNLPGLWKKISASYIFKDVFRLRTLWAIGAISQIGLSALVAWPWCIVPATALLASSLTITLLQLTVFKDSNTFLEGVLPGRSTAQPPSGTTGRYGTVPGAQPLVVFHFGVRFNHPLGLLAPGGPMITTLFKDMLTSLHEDRCRSKSRYGLLGASLFRGGERESLDTMLFVLYFRSVEGLHRFAHDPIHLRGLRWLREPGRGHISAFHETFCVPAGGYETLYINTAPTLLGDTYVLYPEGQSEDENQDEDQDQGEATERGRRRERREASQASRKKIWLNSLVDAKDRRVKTMGARLNRAEF